MSNPTEVSLFGLQTRPGSLGKQPGAGRHRCIVGCQGLLTSFSTDMSSVHLACSLPHHSHLLQSGGTVVNCRFVFRHQVQLTKEHGGRAVQHDLEDA
jgi:hypothetical protein